MARQLDLERVPPSDPTGEKDAPVVPLPALVSNRTRHWLSGLNAYMPRKHKPILPIYNSERGHRLPYVWVSKVGMCSNVDSSLDAGI